MDETIKNLNSRTKNSTRSTRRRRRPRSNLLWTLTITVAVIVVPLIGLPFAIPMVLSYNVFGF